MVNDIRIWHLITLYYFPYNHFRVFFSRNVRITSSFLSLASRCQRFYGKCLSSLNSSPYASCYQHFILILCPCQCDGRWWAEPMMYLFLLTQCWNIPMLSRSLNIVRAFAPVPLLETMAKIMPDPIWKFNLRISKPSNINWFFIKKMKVNFFF